MAASCSLSIALLIISDVLTIVCIAEPQESILNLRHKQNKTTSRQLNTDGMHRNQYGTPGEGENDFTLFYPFNIPRGRAGKYLNISLSPPAMKTRSRIVNSVDQYNQPNDVGQDTPDYYMDYQQPKIKTRTCMCVPSYLCRDGSSLSGGLIISPLRRGTRDVQSSHKNWTTIDQRKAVVHQTTIGQSSNQCHPGHICCEISNNNHPQWDDYPVATPIPDDQVYTQTRLGSGDSCGQRHAYGVQGRLNDLRYLSDVAEFGEYPWQVAILKKVDGSQSLFLCGGALVSNRHVATAAHCLRRTTVHELHVRLGEWDVHREDEIYPSIDVQAVHITIHPKFSSSNLQNDIAIVEIQDIGHRLPHVTPACLPRPQQRFYGSRCWVSGWGKDGFGPQGEYQNVLKEVDVPVLPPTLCEMKLKKTRLGPFFKLDHGFLCAGGEKGKDACTGDGGSPLVCEESGLWYVVGLVSWGVGCGLQDVPGVYVNMEYYLEWIRKIISK